MTSQIKKLKQWKNTLENNNAKVLEAPTNVPTNVTLNSADSVSEITPVSESTEQDMSTEAESESTEP